MERPRRSPKKKTDPAFVYGKEKPIDQAAESKKEEKVVNKDIPLKKKTLGAVRGKYDKLSRKKEENNVERENKIKLSSVQGSDNVQPKNEPVQQTKEPAPSPPRSTNHDMIQKLTERPETVDFNYQVKEGKKVPCNATFYTKRLDKWIEAIFAFYCVQHKNGVHPLAPSKEKFMGNVVIKLPHGTGPNTLQFRFNDKTNFVLITGSNFQTWKESDFREILGKLNGPSAPSVKKEDSICDEIQSKPVPSSSRSATPVPRRARLSLKGAKEGKAVQKLAPLFNQPKEASTAPDMKSGLNGTVGSKTPSKHREKETICVAALHNLGNTCFLNSILQILRHTPGFVDQLNVLAKEIKITEKERSLVAELEDKEEEEQILTWKLVMNIQELFKRMTSREEAVARGDTKYIAIRPYDLLDTIERLNPMFQGNLQQDAHEFLRCILAYIQEAAKEANKYRKTIQDAAREEKLSMKSEAEIEERTTSEDCEDVAEGDCSKPKEESGAMDSKSHSVTFKVDDKGDQTKQKEDTMLTDNELDDDIRIEPIDFDTKYESDTKSIDSVESVALLETAPLEYLSPSKIKTEVTVETSPVKPEPVGVHEASTKFTVKSEPSCGENGHQTDDNDCEVTFVEEAEKGAEVKSRKRLCRGRLTAKKVKEEENNDFPTNGESGEPGMENDQKTMTKKLSRKTDKKHVDDKNKNSLLKFLKPLETVASDTVNNTEATGTGAKPGATTISQEDNVWDQLPEESTAEKTTVQESQTQLSQADEDSMDVQITGHEEGEKPKRGRKRKPPVVSELPDKKRGRGRPSKTRTPNGAAGSSPKMSVEPNTSADSETLIEPEPKAPEMSYPKITSMFKAGPAGRRRLGIRGSLSTIKAAVINRMENGTTVKTEASCSEVRNERDLFLPSSGAAIADDKNGVQTEESHNHAEGSGIPVGNGDNATIKTEDSLSGEEAVRPDSPETVRLKSEALEQGKHSVVKLKKLNKVEFTKYCGPDIKPKSILEITRKTEDVADCVEQLFQGTMAHRTRCLECECYNDRKEEYQDISVPVVKKQTRRHGSDESDDEESDEPTAWIVNAMQEVERLRDDNKYRCERCDHLVEAERSMQYPVIPAILTLHLKRFAALNGYFGGFTKNTDYVATPTVLPPLQQESDDNSRYELYGVVTHSGFSLSSGHYVSYVRAPPGQRSISRPAPTSRSAPTPSLPQSSPPPEQASLPSAGASFSARDQNNVEMADPNNNADTNNNLDASSPNRNLSPAQEPGGSGESPESVVTAGASAPNPPSAASTSNAPYAAAHRSSDAQDNMHYWYECDDDVVSVLSPKDFEQALSPNATGTPYMLFYCKVSI